MGEKKPEISIDIEILNKYLLLFGLRENFSLEELSASYRVLAKLNHPDISKENDSLKTMTEINEGYQYLQDALSSGALIFLKEKDIEPEKNRVEDIFYSQYKKHHLPFLKFRILYLILL